MKDAQKPDHVSLNTLIGRLKEGRFVIPDFQREFEWRPWDIRDLMKSIFQDYYIGSLLLWKGKKENFEALSCEPIYGFKGTGSPEYIVLDGQQRLTAMYYAFVAPDLPVPNRANRFHYFIRIDRFMADEQDAAFPYEWTYRWTELLKNRTEQYAEHLFPLSVVGAGGWALPNWVQGYEEYWRNRAAAAADPGEVAAAQRCAENAAAFGDHLKDITEKYQISYIELDRDLEVDKVCDIFTQINSRGIRLDVFDLINALLKPKGLQLKQMWRSAEKKLEFVKAERMNVYVLQVMSILLQAYCSPKYLYFLLPGQEKPIRDPDGTRRREVLVPNVDEFRRRWDEAVDAVHAAIERLRHPHEYGVVSSAYLPYESILPAFAALHVHAKQVAPERRLDAQRKIRHWYWASVFNNRYSGSVESTSARDFQDVKAWIEDDAAQPAFVTEFATRFRGIDLRKEVRAGTSVYNGVFNLLVIQGARDWMSGQVPQAGDLDDHHIVPASWGAKHFPDGLANSILNRTPLTSDTNRKLIRDRLPNQYLPELIAANGDARVRGILDSHFISAAAQAILLRDPFGPPDFEAFLAERQRTIQDAIEGLLVKDRLDLSPPLRELDEQIERTELALRRVVLEGVNGDSRLVPNQILDRVDERIQRASNKDAALDADALTTLEGRLPYFDLRELQATITNKALWPSFEPRFKNKESLDKKFDQLAELRNCIRHSRPVTDYIRMEGEAAVAWFREVLGK